MQQQPVAPVGIDEAGGEVIEREPAAVADRNCTKSEIGHPRCAATVEHQRDVGSTVDRYAVGALQLQNAGVTVVDELHLRGQVCHYQKPPLPTHEMFEAYSCSAIGMAVLQHPVMLAGTRCDGENLVQVTVFPTPIGLFTVDGEPHFAARREPQPIGTAVGGDHAAPARGENRRDCRVGGTTAPVEVDSCIMAFQHRQAEDRSAAIDGVGVVAGAPAGFVRANFAHRHRRTVIDLERAVANRR